MEELLAGKQPTVFYYLQLMQPIIRETDTAFYSTPGYVQNFQFNPFGVHLYTETGMMAIVISSIPKQKRRIQYYAWFFQAMEETPPTSSK